MFEGFKLQIAKLMKYVGDETNLRAEVNAEGYPLRISFYKDAEQLDMFHKTDASDGMIDAATGERIVPHTTFEFFANMRIVTEGKFKIADAIFSKLKSLSKEANRIFLNEFCEAMSLARKDLRELGWIEQIGGEIDSCDGVPRIMGIANPKVLVEYLDWTREGRVHGAEVLEDIRAAENREYTEDDNEDDAEEGFEEETESGADGDAIDLGEAAARAAELSEMAKAAYAAANLEQSEKSFREEKRK